MDLKSAGERRVEFKGNTPYLLALPSTHERRLSAWVVDVCPKILNISVRRSFGFLDGLINFSLGLLVDTLEEIEW